MDRGSGTRLARWAVALFAAVSTLAPAGAAPPGALLSRTVRPELSLRYWTPARFKSATPAAPVVVESPAPAAIADRNYPFKFTRRTFKGSPRAMPASTMGRVFFTNSATGARFTCSGAAINSANLSLVLTAGHCLHAGPSGSWHSNWVFVPGYRDGAAPHGVWAATLLGTHSAYSATGDHRFDVGLATVAPKSGRKLVSVVGGQGITFSAEPRGWHRVFGYAFRPDRLRARRLQVCSGPFGRIDGADAGGAVAVGMGCDLAGGISGAPWIRDFERTGGYVDGVASYKYRSHPKGLYGPHLGPAAYGVYELMGG